MNILRTFWPFWWLTNLWINLTPQGHDGICDRSTPFRRRARNKRPNRHRQRHKIIFVKQRPWIRHRWKRQIISQILLSDWLLFSIPIYGHQMAWTTRAGIMTAYNLFLIILSQIVFVKGGLDIFSLTRQKRLNNWSIVGRVALTAYFDIHLIRPAWNGLSLVARWLGVFVWTRLPYRKSHRMSPIIATTTTKENNFRFEPISQNAHLSGDHTCQETILKLPCSLEYWNWKRLYRIIALAPYDQNNRCFLCSLIDGNNCSVIDSINETNAMIHMQHELPPMSNEIHKIDSFDRMAPAQ